MFRYHADPNDYYRFTHESLKRNLLESVYSDIEIYAIGNGLLILLAEQFSRLILSNKIFTWNKIYSMVNIYRFI